MTTQIKIVQRINNRIYKNVLYPTPNISYFKNRRDKGCYTLPCCIVSNRKIVGSFSKKENQFP